MGHESEELDDDAESGGSHSRREETEKGAEFRWRESDSRPATARSDRSSRMGIYSFSRGLDADVDLFSALDHCDGVCLK